MKRLLTLLFALSLALALAVPAAAGGGTAVAGETRTIGFYGYVDTEGGLWLWGPNLCCSAGQDVSKTYIDKPTKVMDNVVSFARWEQATIVLKNDGSGWTFGNDFARGVVIDKVKGNYIYYKPAKGPSRSRCWTTASLSPWARRDSSARWARTAPSTAGARRICTAAVRRTEIPD